MPDSEQSTAYPTRANDRERTWPHSVPDTLGVLWVILVGIVVLIPALVHGSSYGPFDLLSRYGLTSNPHVAVHNANTTDQIDELIPWATLAWTQVHQGHLPLWNPYSALGLPLAFNWQSATFSVPALLSYLAPLHVAFTVQVATTLAISGTGVYVLGRVLRMSVLAAAFSGMVFELSGAMLGWLGWPVTGVMAWAGWLFAASLLILRSKRRLRSIIFLAIVIAAAVYAGQPDTLVVLISVMIVFLATLLILRTPRFRGSGPIVRPVIDLAIAAASGFSLSAPLALPGLQLTARSIRLHATNLALPLHDVIHLAFATFDGSATSSLYAPEASGYYPETVAYVGVIVLVLAVLGVAMEWRRREVIALATVVVVGGALVFLSPLVSLIDRIRALAAVDWHHGLAMVALGLAVLAGFGIDVLVRSYKIPAVRYWMGGGFLLATLSIIYLWFEGRGHLPASLAPVISARNGSFIWPTICTVLGLVVVLTLIVVESGGKSINVRFNRFRVRLGLAAALTMFAGETSFLLAVGAPPLPSSSSFFEPTPAVQQLQKAVGSSLVGFGTGSCVNVLVPQVGILQEANIAFGIHELTAYDPLIPSAYNRAWVAYTGKTPFLFISVYCPGVTTLTLARLYGVTYVLDPHGDPAPRGGVFDEQIGNEVLYRMPGAAAATLTPVPAKGGFPGVNAVGVRARVDQPTPASWKIETDAKSPQVLRVRLTNVPGWHATIDGRPLQVRPFSGVMLQAVIPPGRHLVEFNYWPGPFTVGLVLALCSALAFVAAYFVAAWRRRSSSTPT